MNVGTVVGGVGIVVLGLGTLYATRHLLPKVDVPDEVADYLRLLTAMFAGVLIVFGLILVLFGLFGR